MYDWPSHHERPTISPCTTDHPTMYDRPSHHVRPFIPPCTSDHPAMYDRPSHHIRPTIPPCTTDHHTMYGRPSHHVRPIIPPCTTGHPTMYDRPSQQYDRMPDYISNNCYTINSYMCITYLFMHWHHHNKTLIENSKPRTHDQCKLRINHIL